MSRATLVLLALSTVQEAALAQASSTCADERTTPAVAACWQARVAEQDAVLAQVVERLRGRWRVRDASEAVVKVEPAFLAAQQAWWQYRAQECAARALAYGVGTGAAAAEGRCRLAMTHERLEALRRDW